MKWHKQIVFFDKFSAVAVVYIVEFFSSESRRRYRWERKEEEKAIHKPVCWLVKKQHTRSTRGGLRHLLRECVCAVASGYKCR